MKEMNSFSQLGRKVNHNFQSVRNLHVDLVQETSILAIFHHNVVLIVRLYYFDYVHYVIVILGAQLSHDILLLKEILVLLIPFIFNHIAIVLLIVPLISFFRKLPMKVVFLRTLIAISYSLRGSSSFTILPKRTSLMAPCPRTPLTRYLFYRPCMIW